VPAPGGRFTKGICAVIFPPAMPLPERFPAAKNAGFDGVEIPAGDSADDGSEITPRSAPGQVERIADAAHRAGITIVSLWVSQPLWTRPLNSPDPAVRDGVSGGAALTPGAQEHECERGGPPVRAPRLTYGNRPVLP
jgi:sugar phosphate isomerase/epimerase